MIHSDIDKAWEALEDPNLMVIVQIAPAVRVSLGEAFGLPPGTAVLGKLVTALRLMGVDRVFDTVFAADLTIMEETTEFIGRLKEGRNLPLFTSCCPGWVKYVEHQAPELIPHLSTCRSPQQMFGSVIKRDYARRLGKEPEDVCVISIMPCTAKKFEAARPEFTTDGVPDVDLVLTTQEMAQMIHQSGLRFEELPEGKLDSPFGVTTGSGTVFGATGGVTEAVLRTAHWMLTGEDAEKVDIEEVRGEGRVRTLRTQIDGTEVKVAVAHTLAAARDIIRSVEAGEATYDIIEVMACPGGCVGGGGQPYIKGMKERYRRAEGLYRADRSSPVRRSYENPDVQEVYRQWLGEPNSALAHTYLHTSYTDRSVRHMEPTLVE